MSLGSILIISGPSGCGKSSILKEVFKTLDNYYFSISTTTREIRDGEKDGVDYNFISVDDFKDDIENGMFLEWAKVHNNYYGTSIKPVKKALENGKLVIFDIDVQGQKILKGKLGEYITSLFITSPSQKILRDRLISRNSDSNSIINKRVENAVEEMKSIDKYDYIIINNKLKDSIESVKSIIDITKLKTSLINKDDFIESWKDL